MISINEYINESLTQGDKVLATFLQELCSKEVNGLNDAILGRMLFNLDIEKLKKLNAAYNALYPKEYLPYYVQDDAFLKMNEEKHKEVSNNIAKFILTKRNEGVK